MKLKNLKKDTIVKIQSKGEYLLLMELAEQAGYSWSNSIHPTGYNDSYEYSNNTDAVTLYTDRTLTRDASELALVCPDSKHRIKEVIKFEVGDKVRIRKDLDCCDPSVYPMIDMDMLTCSGQEFVIESISKDRPKIYKTSQGVDEYYWRKRWLEPVLPVPEKLRDGEDLEVDWNNVKVDTPILISDDRKTWYKRHFAHYTNGFVCAWAAGKTSWTVPESTCSYTTAHKYAKLSESEVG